MIPTPSVPTIVTDITSLDQMKMFIGQKPYLGGSYAVVSFKGRWYWDSHHVLSEATIFEIPISDYVIISAREIFDT